MKRPSILMYAPSQTDATSFYRAAGPLSHLARKNLIKVNLAAQYNWFSMCWSDIVLLQRPYSSKHLEIAEIAQSAGCKIWVDYDDDLFNLTTDNPAYKIYNEPRNQKNIHQIMLMADVMTVSTQDLLEKAEKNPAMKGKTIVVPNALPTHMVPWKQQLKRNKLVMWRGSPTHHRDVATVASEIIQISNDTRFDKWTWEFIGDMLWFMTDSMPHERTICVDAIDIMEYFRHIHSVAPSIMIAPLHNNTFTRAKSNIAWLEGLYAGALTVGPDMPEWKVPGCLNFTDGEHFAEIMQGMMLGDFNQAEYGRGMAYAMEHHDLEKVNLKRMAVIEMLMDKKG